MYALSIANCNQKVKLLEMKIKKYCYIYQGAEKLILKQLGANLMPMLHDNNWNDFINYIAINIAMPFSILHSCQFIQLIKKQIQNII